MYIRPLYMGWIGSAFGRLRFLPAQYPRMRGNSALGIWYVIKAQAVHTIILIFSRCCDCDDALPIHDSRVRV
jgi:hypothetical protein